MTGEIRLLHVDDDPGFVSVAAGILEDEDDRFAVVTATSVEEGLARLADGAFDCVVSDYEMPGRDGIDFLRTVREDHPDLPFVLFTGEGSEGIASEAISAGVSEYLQKRGGTDQYAVLANRVRNLVEKHRAERTARQARELTEQADDILWMFTADWEELVFINSAYEAIWGRSTDALDADPTDFLPGVHPEDRDRVRRAMDRLSAGGSVDFEFRVNRSEDYGRWVWVQGQPIRDDDGDVTHVTGFARDVTERRRRERVLEELHTVATEVVTYDTRAAVCRRTVEAARTILAFDICAVLLEDDGLLVPVATSEGVPSEGVTPMGTDEGLAGRTYRTGESVVVDDARAHPDADPQGDYGAAISVPVGDAGVFQAVATDAGVFDETDRDLLELLAAHAARALERLAYTQRLERERNRFEAIFEAMPDPIAHVTFEDDEPLIETFNPAFVETFAPGADDPTGRSVNDLIVPEDRRSDARAVDRRVQAEGDVEREVVRTGDGEERTFLFRATSLDLDAERTEAVGVYTDLTEQRARERELERQNERLERFTSIVSHDLREPLSVAEAGIELAGRDCDSEYLADAAAAVERSLDLTNDLLALAREGRRVGDVSHVALPDLVTACWRTVGTGEATLEDRTTGQVRADRSRLRELLENLFANAVDHGGEEVTVTVGDLPDGFYVADDGPGIPPADREAVFEAGHSTAEDGTGFGLSIVEEIAEAHGWTVTVTDGEDGGARFEVTGVETDR